MPLSLVDVAEALGIGIAIKLMQAFGGQEVKFPKQPKADHEVIKAFGEDDGYRLCHFLGGQLIYVPHGRSRRSARDAIAALEAAGHDRRAIARILGISQRHVRRYAKDARDPRQFRLFD